MTLRRMVSSFVLGVAALVSWAGPAAAQAQDDEEIVVIARPLDEIVTQFVGELSGAPRGDDQMARWDQAICPGIYGLTDTETAQNLIDRMAMRAFELGLNVGEPGCSADILILFSDQPDQLAAAIGQRFERFINARNTSMLGREALSAFVTSGAPVRWWSVASTRSRTGLDIGADGAVRELSPSRIRPMIRQDLSRIVLIVDSRRIEGLRVGALGDYLAMVSFAQIDASADTSGFSTILNLFDGGPTAMTSWDEAYLEGLYGATRAARSTAQQEREIRQTMVDELREAEAETP